MLACAGTLDHASSASARVHKFRPTSRRATHISHTTPHYATAAKPALPCTAGKGKILISPPSTPPPPDQAPQRAQAATKAPGASPLFGIHSLSLPILAGRSIAHVGPVHGGAGCGDKARVCARGGGAGGREQGCSRKRGPPPPGHPPPCLNESEGGGGIARHLACLSHCLSPSA